MESFFNYLWQSALVLTVLYIPFQLLLRKERFFALNRVILLSILVLSLALPLTPHTFPSFQTLWGDVAGGLAPEHLSQMEDVQTLDEVVIKDHPQFEGLTLWIETHWMKLLQSLYLLGFVVFVIWQLRSVRRLYRILHSKENLSETLPDGTRLILSNVPLPSFSWMHSIVISEDDYAENGDTILIHERAHISHHHSLDKILLLVVQILQWWNPFVWLLSDALSQVHEYQADLAVLNNGVNASQYQLLLIRKAAGPAGLALVNGFKRNKLKMRIVMMNNMIKLRGARSRYLALLPMLLVAFVFTATAAESQESLDTQLKLLINREGQILLADGQTDTYVKIENLSAELDKASLDVDDVVAIVADDETPMAVIREVNETLRKSGVQKVTYWKKDGDKAVERWFQAAAVSNSQDKSAEYQATFQVGHAEEEGDVFTVCEEQPEFPGGEQELMKFLMTSMRYPKECADNKIEGRVMLSFIVEKDGSISHIEEVRSPHPLLTAEAQRVVESMPKWKPGKQRGQEVRVKYVLPFTFRLN